MFHRKLMDRLSDPELWGRVVLTSAPFLLLAGAWLLVERLIP